MSDFLSRLAERASPADSTRAVRSTLQPRIRPLFADAARGISVPQFRPAATAIVPEPPGDSGSFEVVEPGVFSPPVMPSQGANVEASKSASGQISAAPRGARMPPENGESRAIYPDISRSKELGNAQDFQSLADHPIAGSVRVSERTRGFDATDMMADIDALPRSMPAHGDARARWTRNEPPQDAQAREDHGAAGVPTLAEPRTPAMMLAPGESLDMRAMPAQMRAREAEFAMPRAIQMRPDAQDLAAQSPRVTIEIGRIEIRAAAVKSPAHSAPVRQAFRPRTSLHDYLNRNPGDDR